MTEVFRLCGFVEKYAAYFSSRKEALAERHAKKAWKGKSARGWNERVEYLKNRLFAVIPGCAARQNS